MNPRQVAMAKLRGYRSYGGSEERAAMYLNHREMRKVFTADLVEAVERLAITGKGTSFPSLGEVLTACRGAFADRRRFEALSREDSGRGSGPLIKDMSPAEREALIADFRAMRKKYVRSFDIEKPGSASARKAKPIDADTLAYIRQQRALRESVTPDELAESPF